MNQALMDSQKTTWVKTGTVNRKWYLIDAKDWVLGRASTRIAMILMGKTRPTYTPSVDCGDFVIVVNVGKVQLTGNKVNVKHAFHHSSHPGGGRSVPWKKLYQEKPERLLHLSVKRMLPKNKLASRQILRLKMYQGDSHPHAVQNPVKIEN